VWRGIVGFQECSRCDRMGAEYMGECDGSVCLLNWNKLQKKTWSYLFFPLFYVLLEKCQVLQCIM
jgi:hypothetical protein